MIQRLRRAAVTLSTLGFIAVYLLIMLSLAITVDRRFFFNDGVAIFLWIALGLTLAVAARSLAKRQ